MPSYQKIEWNVGDVFLLPGGETVVNTAGVDNAVLWVVTNEPQMEFENTRPLKVSDTDVEVVYYPSASLSC